MKTLTGIVTSAKMEKTAVVAVKRIRKNPIYKKITRAKKNFSAHNEIGAGEGDAVRIRETRPISKTKKWQILEIIRKKR